MKFFTFVIVPNHTTKVRQLRISYIQAKIGLVLFVLVLLLAIGLIIWHTKQTDKIQLQRLVNRELLDQKFELQRMSVILESKKKNIADKAQFINRVKNIRLHNMSIANQPKINLSYKGNVNEQLAQIKNNFKMLEINLFREQTILQEKRAILRRMPSINPVPGGRYTSPFGWRKDPFTSKRHFHEGLDIGAPEGTPIHATADGRIVWVGPNGGYGNFLIIDHGYNVITRYGHMAGFNVKVGQFVHRNDIIGYVGHTGHATGHHLHYEVWINDQVKNPRNYIF